jgi:hypothetical protein
VVNFDYISDSETEMVHEARLVSIVNDSFLTSAPFITPATLQRFRRSIRSLTGKNGLKGSVTKMGLHRLFSIHGFL